MSKTSLQKCYVLTQFSIQHYHLTIKYNFYQVFYHAWIQNIWLQICFFFCLNLNCLEMNLFFFSVMQCKNFSWGFSRSRIPCFKICCPLSEFIVHEDDGKEYSDNEDSDDNKLKDCHYIWFYHVFCARINNW